MGLAVAGTNGRLMGDSSSANKAKKFGFFGHVDSEEAILSVADEFVALKILPDPKLIVPRTSSK